MPSKPIAHVPGVPYSSHNLSHTNRFTTSPGILKPVLIDELVPGGRYRLDIGMLADTFPTENPLFGTFEVHTDVFLCPLKNWYANWHTNYPSGSVTPDEQPFYTIRMSGNLTDANRQRFSLSNIGQPGADNAAFAGLTYQQMFPALPDSLFDYLGFPVGAFPYSLTSNPSTSGGFGTGMPSDHILKASPLPNQYLRSFSAHGFIAYYDIFRSYYANPQEENFFIYDTTPNMSIRYSGKYGALSTTSIDYSFFVYDRIGLANLYANFGPNIKSSSLSVRDFVRLHQKPLSGLLDWLNEVFTYRPAGISGFDVIKTFNDTLGTVGSFGLPYGGLVVRTYRPDLLTSWISQEGIDKVRAASSMKASSEGVITFEQILTGQKVYDYTTHSQLSGGRYKDWVRAIYRVTPNMDSDQPILLSHSRTRMDFQGIYQNSSTESAVSPSNQRTALGGSVSVGQAQSVNDSIVFDCTQPSVLVVMNSIVPIADYSQGIDPMLLHTDFKHCYSPDYDGLGWQPLTSGMLAPQWRPSELYSGADIISPWLTVDPFTSAIGYQPAWEEYRSRVNRIHGDFHDNMSNFVLQRIFPSITYSGNIDQRFYSSYIIPDIYQNVWAVSDQNQFRVQYAFGYRARLPMSKYSLPKLA